jgi:peptide deformylase
MRKWWRQRVHRYALRQLRTLPDPVLRKSAKQSRPGIIAWLREKRLLFVFHHQEDALGLAAPQIGCSRMIFVVLTNAEGREVVFHNPIVEPLTTTEERGYEACLSIPGGEVEVSRPQWVRINGENAWGRRIPMMEGFGLFAVMLQHERDHLNGVLITDYGPLVTPDDVSQ